MSNKGTDFPQYRMLSNRKVYYQILSDDEFVEVSFLGDRAMRFQMLAKQYPEKLKIMQMLACEEPYELLPTELHHHFDA